MDKRIKQNVLQAVIKMANFVDSDTFINTWFWMNHDLYVKMKARNRRRRF